MRNNTTSLDRFLRGAAVAVASVFAAAAHAAAPGITGTGGTDRNFDLTAAPGYITEPDGASIYSWGYGCNTAPSTSEFVPAGVTGGFCTAGSMQLPGPTLVVNQGDTVTVTLHNNLPAAAGNTSIIFPGFTMQAYASGNGVAGLLTQEAARNGTVTYTFIADTAGTHSYYSGTQGDLQVEMGLYGALIVLPSSSAAGPLAPLNGAVPTGYGAYIASARAAPTATAGLPDTCFAVGGKRAGLLDGGDFRLAAAAYNHPETCYDREYLFQFSEMDSAIHRQVEAQSLSAAGQGCVQSTGCLNVQTEPYHPEYFMINGRSMPDDMDSNYATQYPHQPYNGNPHMHPCEQVLLRVSGQGRMQHPFHEHANHVRILARDGNPLFTSNNNLAGPLMFTTTTTPGMAFDGIFEFTAKNLNWDPYGHHTADANNAAVDPGCTPDANGFNTGDAAVGQISYWEWCADHDKPLEAHPFGNVGSGGPITLPDPNILANGPWYGGSPYLGFEATGRAVGGTPIPPSGTVGNDPGAEAGFAYMWHSHNEREITTNNIFPGGMMMMLLIDPITFTIDETQ